MNKERPVRVRFAPSPTGGLHLGGVRTVLYNYLFAKKQAGKFILRIEDTDQSRWVEGAEEYIYDCLNWCGLNPDESPLIGGAFEPYRQSERKDIYKKYALQLVEQGFAYYAFDTPEEIEKMRVTYKTENNTNPQYDQQLRGFMRNSTVLSAEETAELLAAQTPYVIRIKMPKNETVQCNDAIRGTISFDTNLVDDKVLLKADGMPTYHLAVVVDDYLMKISHAFRGEEWLPSAPVHLLLWKYLGWENDMPQWAHLPLILKPDGHGKLSKRDGDRLGFPVFALNWTDPKTKETAIGFKEKGFLPEAFINILAVLGWNNGTEQELFSMEELVAQFSLERVHKGGAKFDYEKAKWYNHQYIQQKNDLALAHLLLPVFEQNNCPVTIEKLLPIIPLIKDRCSLLTDFWDHGAYFFQTPTVIDIASIAAKWNDLIQFFFNQLCLKFQALNNWDVSTIEHAFNELMNAQQLNKGLVLLPFRVLLVGGKFGPNVFAIASEIGKAETIKRLENNINNAQLNKKD